MLANQGLLGIAFFEATAFIILLVLFLLFRRDHFIRYFRLWIAGWLCFTFCAFCEVALLSRNLSALWLTVVVGNLAAIFLFAASVVQLTAGPGRRRWPAVPLAGVVLLGIYYLEYSNARFYGNVRWATALLESGVCLWAGMVLWRSAISRRGHGARLLAGVLLLIGLHGLDRPVGPEIRCFFSA